jgi:hypothetical protein
MLYAYFDSIFGSGYVTKKNKKKRGVCGNNYRFCVIALGCVVVAVAVAAVAAVAAAFYSSRLSVCCISYLRCRLAY